MVANDLIDEIILTLQQKSNHWQKREIFIHLSRAYNLLQFDLPFFAYKEEIELQKDEDSFYLLFEPLANISLSINGNKYRYSEIANLYKHRGLAYCFEGERVLLNCKTKDDKAKALILYKYGKRLKNVNCGLDLPPQYIEALRLLTLSFIYEKPILNTKERNLSAYYKNQYTLAVKTVALNINTSAKQIKSIYQRI